MERPAWSEASNGTSMAAPLARRVLLRSLTLQASWNDQRMQNLGLLVSLVPWLERQRLSPEELRRICRRYYGFFNTNPYLSTFVIGGLLRLERDRQEGKSVADRQVAGIRDTLARACGSLGDQLFWLGLRPALMLACCGLACIGRWETILGLLAVFTLAQLDLRRRGLALGFGRGPGLVDVLARPFWHRAIAGTRSAALALTGLLVGCYIAGAADLAYQVGAGRLVGAILAGFALPHLVRQKAPGEVQLLLAFAVAVGLALVLPAA